jgi:hypothetical protein
MNGELNSIRILPRLIAPRRTTYIEELAASRLLMPDEMTGGVIASVERPLRPCLALTELSKGEFWETISYAVIGLCAWVGVGLSFI